MNEKPEALRLAENLVNQWYGLMASDSGLPGVSPVIVGALRLDAAAELRRLHAKNERLRELLTEAAAIEPDCGCVGCSDKREALKVRIDAALRQESPR